MIVILITDSEDPWMILEYFPLGSLKEFLVVRNGYVIRTFQVKNEDETVVKKLAARSLVKLALSLLNSKLLLNLFSKLPGRLLPTES
jgi:hypothetical protein